MNGKKGLVVMAAFAGLLGSGVALSGCASGGSSSSQGMDKHSCKGMNSCKGKGGCAVEGKNSCKGMNACKGMGGCATDKASCSGKSGCKGGAKTGSSCGKNSCA